MIAIRGEIDKVASGEWDAAANPLTRRAAHRAGAHRRPRVRRADGGVPDRLRPRQVLAAGGPDRPGLRRPQPVLRLPVPGSLRVTVPPSHYQAVLDRYQADRRLPSLVVGVLDGGALAWSGFAGAETTTDTQYRIGSITKTLTAVLVLQCRDDGLLALDDPIGTHVPETGYADGHGRVAARPRVRHAERAGGSVVGAVARASRSTSCWRPTTAPARSSRPASTTTTATSASPCSARRSRGCGASRGCSSCRPRILDPLGMGRTSYLPEAPHAQGLSVHHLAGTLTPEPAYDTGAMAPAGQLWSTIEDLAAFAAFVALGNPEVLADETLAQMRRAVDPAPDYGLGHAAGAVVRRHAGRPHRLDARLPGHAVRRPAHPRRRGRPDQRHHRLQRPRARPGAARRPHARPGRAVGADDEVPGWAAELLGYWHWGNSAFEVRWTNEQLEWRDLARSTTAETFVHDGDRIVGTAGYHHGETLHVVRRRRRVDRPPRLRDLRLHPRALPRRVPLSTLYSPPRRSPKQLSATGNRRPVGPLEPAVVAGDAGRPRSCCGCRSCRWRPRGSCGRCSR